MFLSVFLYTCMPVYNTCMIMFVCWCRIICIFMIAGIELKGVSGGLLRWVKQNLVSVWLVAIGSSFFVPLLGSAFLIGCDNESSGGLVVQGWCLFLPHGWVGGGVQSLGSLVHSWWWRSVAIVFFPCLSLQCRLSQWCKLIETTHTHTLSVNTCRCYEATAFSSPLISLL